MTAGLLTITDFIRYGASRFATAGLIFGHLYDTAIDEATYLVLGVLHLPPDLPPAYGQSRLTSDECQRVLALIERRVTERKSVGYLLGEGWFAGVKFRTDERALVPRSPIAELIEDGFAPWLNGHCVERALDLCTGSGCIGIAMAVHNPGWHVDIADLSQDALSLAGENIVANGVQLQVRAVRSDLFSALGGERYDLIVSNPPYVTQDEYDEYIALGAEYGHEPKLAFTAGEDGLDVVLEILDQAAAYLTDAGMLIVEVGESKQALVRLLPNVPFRWVEFKAGPIGVFVLRREDLLEHIDIICALAAARR